MEQFPFYYTSRAKGEINQDVAIAFANEHISCLAVFDGHGKRGKEIAEAAAKILKKNLLEKSSTAPCTLSELSQAIEDIDQEIEGSDLGYLGYHEGCTVACVVLKREQKPQWTKKRLIAMTANAGDSRTLLIQDDEGIFLSEEHNTSNRAERDRIRDCGGFISNNRVGGALLPTRGIGDFRMKHCITARPYTSEQVISGLDRYLVIATDGIWDVWTPEQIIDDIEQFRKYNLCAKCSSLVVYSREKPLDDTTCILVDLKHEHYNNTTKWSGEQERRVERAEAQTAKLVRLRLAAKDKNSLKRVEEADG